MKNAREKLPDGSPGRSVSADEIGLVPEPFNRPLICEFCTVGPVRGYKNVPNLFRLLPGALHQPECRLNPTEFIRSIAHGSHGLAHVTDQGLLRLELPEHINAMPPFPHPDVEAGTDAPVRQRDTTTVRPYLPPAITSAVKIAQFLQMHGFDSKTVDRFRIKPHSRQSIAWGEFCYGPDHRSYAALYERLCTGKVITHPIALQGTVQRIDHDKNGRRYATLAVNVPTGEKTFRVVLRSAYDTLVRPLAAGTHVLAVGNWSIFDGGFAPQLRLFAEHHWQVAYWTDDERTGRPTEPSCPPPTTSRQRVTAQTEARKRRHEKQRPAIPPETSQTPPSRPVPAPAEPPAPTEPTPPTAPPAAAIPRDEPASVPRLAPMDPPTGLPTAGQAPPMPTAPTPPPLPPDPPTPSPPLQPSPQTSPPTRRRGLRRWFGRQR